MKSNLSKSELIKSITRDTFLTGSGAPTETTKADFVGQMYSDTENNKLYQCIATTESNGATEKYKWIKVIRENDYANHLNDDLGCVRVVSIFGIMTATMVKGGVAYPGNLMINCASKSDIDEKQSAFVPIVPSNLDYAVMSVCRNVIGKFTVTPMVSGVTAKFMFDLIYPFDFDGYKIFVNDTETSDGIIKKGSGFVTAPAIFDGDNVKVYFYSGKTAVFYAGVKKLSEIAHAKNGSIKYGVLCT